MKTRWKAIEGFEGYYEVSNQGEVRSVDREIKSSKGIRRVKGRVIWQKTTQKGYKQVMLSRDGVRYSFYVHRLVAKAFIPNPEGKTEVNHKKGDKTKNGAKFLEWATRLENMQHAHDHGLIDYSRGEGHTNAKITENEAREILRLAKDKLLPQMDIADRFGISITTVSQIKNGKRWPHLQEVY